MRAGSLNVPIAACVQRGFRANDGHDLPPSYSRPKSSLKLAMLDNCKARTTFRQPDHARSFFNHLIILMPLVGSQLSHKAPLG